MAVGEDVYCTLVLSDSYLPGAAVLAKSLRDSGTTKKLACLIDQDSLRPSTVTELQSLYNYTIPVSRIGTPAPKNLYLMGRPDLLFTFTKIHLWRMTQFRKIVYIDSDVVALRAPDELFDIPEDFAAAPDVGWPDAFNTGVMVVAPNMGDYWALRTLAGAGDSFDGADQGLLNQYFEHKPWKRLSFTYNCTPSANYQYEPAYRYYKRDISMVHFIGSEKPWQRGRATDGGMGAYQELFSRWWAVYDRHFKVSTSDYISSGQREPVSHVIQQEVKGEVPGSAPVGYYATGYPVDSTSPAPPPARVGHSATGHPVDSTSPAPPSAAPSAPPSAPPPTTPAEEPLTEPGEAAENIDQGRVEPQPTSDVRKFSAPYMEWDATRDAPPPESKPEAPNFPQATYEFTNDPTPFRPPASYPEPPKDMWYEVPKEKPKRADEKLPPIFPWEERELPKPSRKFIEDVGIPPPPEPEPEPQFAGADELEVSTNDKPEASPTTPTSKVDHKIPWDAFATTTKNAWDEVEGIENYVRALSEYQRNRDKIQAAHHQSQAQPEQTHVLSPSNEPEPEDLVEKVKKRRESLILTDFPSAIERPSLPVTPAPIRRSTFWGGEKDEENQLPPAEGVPDQADWDPSAQLEQLRRNSLIATGDLKFKLPERKAIPNRQMPESAAAAAAAPVAEEASSQPPVALSGAGTPHGLVNTSTLTPAVEAAGAKPALSFAETDFGTPSSGSAVAVEVLSPTSTPQRPVEDASEVKAG